MNKWLCLITSLLLMETSVEGWHGSFRSSQERVNSEGQSVSFSNANFPLNPDQEWFIDPSYLLWKSVLGDLDYGGKVTSTSLGGGQLDLSYKIKEPNFNWDSGFRIGIGKFLPYHDKWDISLYSTYVYGDATDTTRTGDLLQGTGFSASQGLFIFLLSEDSHCSWRLNYFVEDLILGRQFQMTPKITFHPYVGLRGAWIYNYFKSRHYGDIAITSDGTTTTLFGSLKNKLQSRFWGVGPRIGSNFDFALSSHWSLLGNLAASVLYGRYHVKQSSLSDLGIRTFNLPVNAFSKNRDDTILTNLEGYLGLSWEKWFRGQTVRFAPALLFEGSLWFNMDHFSNPSDTFSQNHGSLGFMGLTFNFLLDF